MPPGYEWVNLPFTMGEPVHSPFTVTTCRPDTMGVIQGIVCMLTQLFWDMVQTCNTTY